MSDIIDKKVDGNDLDRSIIIWQKTIDVQMHFNDIEMRIRNYFITVILAIIAAVGLTIQHEIWLPLGQVEIHFGLFLIFAARISSYLFYFMDRYWYHNLLKGSVDHAEILDENLSEAIPALGLTTKISEKSSLENFRSSPLGFVARILRITSPSNNKANPAEFRSIHKIELFYKTPIRIFDVILICGILFGGVMVGRYNLWQWFCG